MSQETLIDGKRIDYCIDALCRRTSLQTDLFHQTLVEFDPVGNLCHMQIQGQDSSYAYDDLYQLIRETGLFTHTYACDSLYNRLQKDNEAYEVNALNQIVSHCEYDLNGNPTRRGDARYVYDALDRLIRLEAPGLMQVFTYDSEHRCLSKTTIEGAKKRTLYFLYDDKNEIGAFDEALQPRLHTVTLVEGSHALGRKLAEIDLVALGCSVTTVRRKGARQDTTAPLAEGDVVVLLGAPAALSGGEVRLLTGK